MEKVKNVLKRFWAPAALVGAGVFMFDSARLQLELYVMGTVAAILVAAFYILDDRDGWGILPYLDLEELANKAKESAIGSSVVFASVLYLISVIIQAAVVK